MAGGAILDTEHFSAMTGGDVALQAEILALFRAQAALWERLLIPDAAVVTWTDTAHMIKGSARGLGLWRLAEACELAERLGRSGALDAGAVHEALAQVRGRLTEALAALPSDASSDETGFNETGPA